MSEKNKAGQSEVKSLEHVINRYSADHASHSNQVIHYFTIPLVSFAVLGIIWSIPFPYLDILGRYNGFVNWASFIIAFSIYYYYRFSPVISYVSLLMIFAFSGGIVELEKLNTQNGWPELWMISTGILVIGSFVQYMGHRAEGQKPSVTRSLKAVLDGPLWLFHIILTKADIRH